MTCSSAAVVATYSLAAMERIDLSAAAATIFSSAASLLSMPALSYALFWTDGARPATHMQFVLENFGCYSAEPSSPMMAMWTNLLAAAVSTGFSQVRGMSQ